MKSLSNKIMDNINESIDYPKFESELMADIVDLLESKEGVEVVSSYMNIEGSYVCTYTFEGERFIISIDML